MGVQERKYMGRGDDQSLFSEPVEPVQIDLNPPKSEPVDLSTQATKSLRAATAAVESEIKKLKDTIKDRDEAIRVLKDTVVSVRDANVAKPDIAPIFEGVCYMLMGLVYCRPVDEADRLKIVAAAEKGHAILDQIAGCPVNFPAAKMLYEAASREYYDFVNRKPTV